MMPRVLLGVSEIMLSCLNNQRVIKLSDSPISWTAAMRKHAVMKITGTGFLRAQGMCLFINEACNASWAAVSLLSTNWTLRENSYFGLFDCLFTKLC